ncbi:amidohydrolase [Luedemannella helvata]|uniref:amidohydrolase n=1 Tax=Luedemannella helvata TaxID=349315 RepID=UPI0031DB0E96
MAERTDDLIAVYKDLHSHPELSQHETRTAAIVAEKLRATGFDVTTDIGGHGLAGVLHRGQGPTVLLRADMDALPVAEQTGLDYASTVTTTDQNGQEVPVMHACGHDMHVTCMLGAARVLAGDTDGWRGTLILVFQPAEELGTGAQAMIDDGLYKRVGTPDIVLGQHVSPLPAGMIGLRAGTSYAASDGLRVVMHGKGSHGSRPEASIDPVVMAAATVMRLQTVVSREIAGTDTAVLTIGAMHSGTKENIIPDRAELLMNVRTLDPAVRDRVLADIQRIVDGEATTSGAPQPPEITEIESFPPVINDPDAVARLRTAFAKEFGAANIIDPGSGTGSEDVGRLATAANAACAYWLLGGADPAPFKGATDMGDIMKVLKDVPSNHSPKYAPVIEPTLDIGIAALVRAARTFAN